MSIQSVRNESLGTLRVPWALLVGFLAIGPALATSDDAPKVHVEYTKSIDFSQYKTFAWIPFQEKAHNPEHAVRITHAVEQELRGKGFKQADPPETASLFVHYQETLEKKLEGTPSRTDSPWQPTNPRFIVDLSRVEIGTIVLEFWDARQKDVIWQGTESHKMGSGDEVDEQIGDLVHDILAGFPPKDKH